MSVTVTDFGDGYSLITLKNSHGLKLSCTDFGARLTSLVKQQVALVLGFDKAADYQQTQGGAIYFGAIVGRVAGRITGAQATISGKTYQFTANENEKDTLHGGGGNGLHDKKWAFEIVDEQVIFTTQLADGLHGFPGTLSVKVIYFLTEGNEWGYEIYATSDKDTLWNPCHHVYYNLSGDASQAIDQHKLWLNASQYEPLEKGLPSMKKIDVTGTAFDFTKEKDIGSALHSKDKQVSDYAGLDHPFFLNGGRSVQASLRSPDGKIMVEMLTNQPSVVIFTANFGTDTPLVGDKRLANHGGITFETQVAPGAEQNPDFGSIVLRAGQTYYNKTSFKIT